MNPQEIELASKIIREMQNATGYGYDTLVQGARMSNIFDLAGALVWASSMIVVATYLWKKMKISEGDNDDVGLYLFLLGVSAFVFFALYVAVINALFGIACPEYFVINKVIMAAAT
jgi:hypothetical protein